MLARSLPRDEVHDARNTRHAKEGEGGLSQRN